MRAIVCAGIVACIGLPRAQEPIEGAGRKPATPVTPAAPAAPTTPSASGTPRPELPGGLGAIDLAKAMTESMRLATPGPEHRKLVALAGRYEVAMTLSAPGLPEQQCTGTALAAAVLGGRYLLVNCNVLVSGARLEGLYLFGFDHLHGLYTASWRDSMSTWSIECSGSLAVDQPERVELQGTMVDAASPTGRPFRLWLEFTADGFQVAVRDRVGEQFVEVMRQRFARTAVEPAPSPAVSGEPPATGAQTKGTQTKGN